MRDHVLLDTGPLVALLDARDHYHEWAKSHMADIGPPLVTCEAVLSEACFLLRHIRNGPQTVMQMVNQGMVTTPFQLNGQIIPIHKLLVRYANVPISLADACLIRMAEPKNGSWDLPEVRDPLYGGGHEDFSSFPNRSPCG